MQKNKVFFKHLTAVFICCLWLALGGGQRVLGQGMTCSIPPTNNCMLVCNPDININPPTCNGAFAFGFVNDVFNYTVNPTCSVFPDWERVYTAPNYSNTVPLPTNASPNGMFKMSITSQGADHPNKGFSAAVAVPVKVEAGKKIPIFIRQTPQYL